MKLTELIARLKENQLTEDEDFEVLVHLEDDKILDFKFVFFHEGKLYLAAKETK